VSVNFGPSLGGTIINGDSGRAGCGTTIEIVGFGNSGGNTTGAFGICGSSGTAPVVAPVDACQPAGPFAKLLWLGVPYPYHFQAGAALWIGIARTGFAGISAGRRVSFHIGTGVETGNGVVSTLVGFGSGALGAVVKTRSGSYQGALRLL